jgi:hypothetical protein
MSDDPLPDPGPYRDPGRPDGPLAAAAVLLPFRGSWSNTNVALLLVVVVVAVAAMGNRMAGALAAVWAAVWFDFFFTLPYYRFTIRNSPDVTTAVCLLLTGLAVSQLAAPCPATEGRCDPPPAGSSRITFRVRVPARPPAASRAGRLHRGRSVPVVH